MKIADILPLSRSRMWHLAKQVGVTHAVSRLPAKVNGEASWEYQDLLLLREKFKDFGLKLEVLEPDLNAQMHKMKLGVEGKDEEIENCKTLIRNMGLLGIPVFCYNFMAQFNWARTSVSTVSRGGALVTSYNHDLMKDAPITEAGLVSEERLWNNLKNFLEQIVPVAEKYKVKLALHPDDPPISPILGVSRIITSVEALQKAIDLVPSEYNGITLCQGTLATTGVDIPQTIRIFGEQKKIFFVHFRDVRGTATNFVETFHDNGQTDMFAAVKSYKEVGFDGPIRIDHTPTLEGESNGDPGYSEMGRLFAIGYLKGLQESVDKGI